VLGVGATSSGQVTTSVTSQAIADVLASAEASASSNANVHLHTVSAVHNASVKCNAEIDATANSIGN